MALFSRTLNLRIRTRRTIPFVAAWHADNPPRWAHAEPMDAQHTYMCYTHNGVPVVGHKFGINYPGGSLVARSESDGWARFPLVAGVGFAFAGDMVELDGRALCLVWSDD
jgi:hypothetical protein